MRVESPPTTHPSPSQCSEAHRQCLHQSFGLLFPTATCPVVYGWPAHPTFILNDVPSYHSICSSLIVNWSPHFHCINRVEYLPTTQPPPDQRCEAHRQSLYKSFGHLYPLPSSPSPINAPIFERRMLYPWSIFHLGDILLIAAVRNKSANGRHCIKDLSISRHGSPTFQVSIKQQIYTTISTDLVGV
ncbi:hypothetical protein T12_6360 [Trichinella patagoniensis]|uniref:Uncharacterized protein n=1 Tax=Trichinella patagoniensis TaxID=990121 RepID=A0A0V1A165_9BILA|nr:hypothetical protein T12_6360 [Trichinella patagoniensis]